MHLSEAELAALAHGEIDRVSGGASAHLASCAECGAKLAAMRRSDREVAELLGQLDHPAPAIRTTAPLVSSPARRRRVGTIAAGLAIAAAAAAAAVPNSPLHKLLLRTAAAVRGESSVSARTEEHPRADQKAGIAFVPGSSLTVRFRNAESGGQVRIVFAGGEQVSVVAAGDAGFSLHQSELDIDSKGRKMSFTLEIPRALANVQVEVDDRVIFEKRGGVVAGSTAHDQNAPYIFDLRAE